MTDLSLAGSSGLVIGVSLELGSWSLELPKETLA